jgi:predicted DsbA family dithiol-disulfide isomerase
MKRYHRVILVVLLLVVCRPGTAFSENIPSVPWDLLPKASVPRDLLPKASVPWDLLPRVTALDESRKNELMVVLRSEPNYGKCKGSMFQCLVAEKPDKTAVRFANFGAYIVSKDVPARSLGFLARERAKFINEETPRTFTYVGSPSLGNEKAKITIVEFAEFKCPYCVNLGSVLKKLVNESNGQVRFVFKHFPLKMHPGSLFSSKAALVAHRQGKFWQMYDLLFKDFSKQTMEDVLGYAQALGLNVERFKSDLEDLAIEELIERDKMEGARATVTGTPTLFINGKMYNLRHDEDFLKDLINEEAERLGLEPPYQDWVYIQHKP